MSLQKLVRRAKMAPAWASVREVRRMLDGCSPMTGLVVVERLKPVGLVMRYDLDRKMGTPYGYSLFNGRAIELVMDGSPLVVRENDSLESVAQRSLKRPDEHIYDEVVVVDGDGILVGLVSMRLMFEALARTQGVIETAGAVCHELNQPLQIIRSYLDLSQKVMSGKTDLGSLAEPLAEQMTRMTLIAQRLQGVTGQDSKPYLPGVAMADLGLEACAPADAGPLR